MKEINEVEYNNIIETSDKKIIVFSAPWCGPCRIYKPQLESFSNESNISVYAVNIDDNGELADKLNIRSVPTTYVYNQDDSKVIIGAKLDEVKSFFIKD